jgi:hypothetical protein
MGSVEDIRQALQDFIAPELRAMTVRLKAMDEKIDLRFDSVDIKFQSLRAEIVPVKELLDLDRRLARLESKQTVAQ